MNAGQTCVAPDYVLVERTVHDAFVDAVVTTIGRFFGADPRVSAAYGRIVSDRHVERLAGYLSGGRIVAGGVVDRAARYVAPTVLVDVDLEAAVMREEIFGPILPVLPVDDIAAAIAFVDARDKPLALYLFTGDARVREAVVAGTSSGGVCINDVVLHLAVPELPLGGVGGSGFGRYHGRSGFDTFSNLKSVLARRLVWEPPWRFPPYKDFMLGLIRRLM
jgi:aldehyde dehydrogenase (NAD+)